MKITLTKDNRFAGGVFIASRGRTRIMISIPNLDAMLGIEPTDAEVRQQLRESSNHDDEPIPHDAIVFRK